MRKHKKSQRTHCLEPVFKTMESASIHRSILQGKGWDCGDINEFSQKDGTVGFVFQAHKDFIIGQNYVKTVKDTITEPKRPKEKSWDKQAEEYAKTHEETEGQDDGVRREDEGGGGEEPGRLGQIGL